MSEALKQAAAYDLIDRFLRNNLYDDDYAKYSDALEAISQPAPSPQPAVPVVSDEQIIAIKKASKATNPTKPGGDTLAFARAILALRPERVLMTDEQWLEYLLRNANNSVLHVAAFVGESIQTRGQWVLLKPANDLRKLVEQAYGITAQAKKEGE